MAIKTFTDNTTLPASDINTFLANSGLVYISTATANSGTTLNITSIFSSTYDNYRLVISGFRATSSDAGITLQLGTGSATNTGYYWAGIYLSAYTASPTVNVHGLSNGAQFETAIISSTSLNAGGAVEIYSPNLATPTTITSVGADVRTAGGLPRLPYSGFQSSTSQFTSVHLTCTASFTSVTATVFGYRKA